MPQDNFIIGISPKCIHSNTYVSSTLQYNTNFEVICCAETYSCVCGGGGNVCTWPEEIYLKMDSWKLISDAFIILNKKKVEKTKDIKLIPQNNMENIENYLSFHLIFLSVFINNVFISVFYSKVFSLCGKLIPNFVTTIIFLTQQLYFVSSIAFR